MSVKISLTGDIGSGKTSVGKILSDVLGAKIYSTGVIVREMASDRGISVVEMNKLMEDNPNLDFEMDTRLKNLSNNNENLIIDSRLAWFFTENTFKVYLSTDINESAKRVFNDNRSVESFGSIESTVLKIKERKQSENERYLKLYGVDCGFMGNYDLVIDTTASSSELVAKRIINSLSEYLLKKERTLFYLYGRRFFPTMQIEEEEASLAKTSEKPFIRRVKLVCYDGDYYMNGKKSHLETLRRLAINDNLIPCEVIFKRKKRQ